MASMSAADKQVLIRALVDECDDLDPGDRPESAWSSAWEMAFPDDDHATDGVLRELAADGLIELSKENVYEVGSSRIVGESIDFAAVTSKGRQLARTGTAR